MVKEYSLDGIEVDYEHFNDIDPDTFAECIGKLFFYLKQNNVVAITSIAPYDNDSLQPSYLALWEKYGNLIDMVDFQFYAYEKGTTISESLQYFKIQSSNYEGGKLLVSFGTDKRGGLTPENGNMVFLSGRQMILRRPISDLRSNHRPSWQPNVDVPFL